MHVDVSTVVPAEPDRVRAEVMTPRLLRHVSWPLIIFTPVHPAELPPTWEAGDYRVRMRALWLVPLGEQTISISFPEAGVGEFVVRDDGSGRVARRWDHLIHIRATADGRSTLYRDRVRIEAGLLTVPVRAFANLLYRWRQLRWRRLARRRFRY
jgi:hypothetical protein